MLKDKKIKNFVLTMLLVALVFTIFYIYSSSSETEILTYGEFKQVVRNGEVQYAHAQGTTIRIKLTDVAGSEITEEDFLQRGKADRIATLGSVSDFYAFCENYVNGELKDTEGNDIVPVASFDYDWLPVPENIISSLMPYLSFLIVGVFAFMIIRSISSANNKSMGFGKTKARNMQQSKVRFADVAGAKEEKQELIEIVDFLKNPKKFTDLGARIPKGVLLVGPPGTGKTMLAKAVAGESKVPFFRISGSDFVEMFVGVGASRVRDLFDQAKHSAPAIVFIDEIDAVGRQRGAGLGGGNDEREQTLNQLLVEMDGFEANEGIIVIAATNRPDVLDPALLRPGRFDRQIFVNMPDVREREEILKVHAKNKVFSSDINFTNIARITTGFSGADLENLLNEAAILAGRDNRPRITMADLNEASTKVMMGPQKRSRVVTERDRKITAYHEAGHAILQKKLPFCDEVQEVSIIPRGMAGGYTMSRPETDDNYATINKLNNLIASYMGGRIAEEIIFNDISTGASNDIEQATKIARKMVTQFGMSKKIGFVNLGSTSEVFIGRDYQSHVQYSEATAKIIDEEIDKILTANYNEAKQILLDNIDKLHALAELLLKRETVFKEEVDAIMKGTSVSTIIKRMTNREKKQKEMLEKEKLERKEQEEKRLQELKEKAFNALKREGIIPQTQKISDSNVSFQEDKNQKIANDVDKDN